MMKNNMDEEELITHVVNVVFAGTDTTTTANFAALLMLGLHPEVQDKVSYGGPEYVLTVALIFRLGLPSRI